MSTLKKLLTLINKKNKLKKEHIKEELILVPYEPIVRSINDSFFAKVKKLESCWEWQGELDRYGYGKFRVGKIIAKAHRYSFELHYGDFDKSLHVLHNCDNPKCVNPTHLFLGSNKDNVADKISKGRQKFKLHRLTQLEKDLVLKDLKESVTTKQIAERFEISIQTVKRLSKEL